MRSERRGERGERDLDKGKKGRGFEQGDSAVDVWYEEELRTEAQRNRWRDVKTLRREVANLQSPLTALDLLLLRCVIVELIGSEGLRIDTGSGTPNVEVEIDAVSIYLNIHGWVNDDIDWFRVAVGAGWQIIMAYVNLGCYYLMGIPVGVVPVILVEPEKLQYDLWFFLISTTLVLQPLQNRGSISE
ncbi:hypothetical protein RJT34_16008 [Clitoria ternatea]|uniref:Uncharacterized protein n=1 Tax=Clitoria ternatea TaxID=43366 RepID=A0AAN9PD90_CLITE